MKYVGVRRVLPAAIIALVAFGIFDGPSPAGAQDVDQEVVKGKPRLAGARRRVPRHMVGEDGLPLDEEQAGFLGSRRRHPEPPPLVGDNVAPATSGKWQWRVLHETWTDDDESRFGAFLRRIGESDCKTTQECLTSPEANPDYASRNPPGYEFYADCADLPYLLRGYFAWNNGLPFSFSSAVDLHPGPQTPGTPSFKITGRYHIVGPGPDARQALQDIARVSTAHYRTPFDYTAPMLPDYYAVKISRASIKPGTVIFDPNGHVVIVYKVTDDGIIHYIDANPGSALTRGVYSSEMDRGPPSSGAGFKRWRPQKLVGAKRLKDGTLSGGRMVLTPDQDLPDRSDEQYLGSPQRGADWKSATFQFEESEIDYFGYVRLALAEPGFRFEPTKEVRARLRSLCHELDERNDSVKAAIKAQMPKREHPSRLPRNIYVTQGDWETYSTASRDAKLRSTFLLVKEDIERMLSLALNGHKLVRYDGNSLREEVLRIYAEETEACTLTYIKSDGTPKALTFDEVKSRLFRMSFDPYHCVERRWGATDPDELSTCRDDAAKTEWYVAEQRLRNQLERTIGDRMDFSLQDLKRQAATHSEVGEDQEPEVDIKAVITAAH